MKYTHAHTKVKYHRFSCKELQKGRCACVRTVLKLNKQPHFKHILTLSENRQHKPHKLSSTRYTMLIINSFKHWNDEWNVNASLHLFHMLVGVGYSVGFRKRNSRALLYRKIRSEHNGNLIGSEFKCRTQWREYRQADRDRTTMQMSTRFSKEHLDCR